MTELIKISDHNGRKLVNARELHEFLIKDAKGGQIGRDFSNWIKDAIEKYSFVKDEDYIVLEYNYKGELIVKNGESDNQYVNKRDYGLTVDMAKELSMVQNNDKGREAYCQRKRSQ